MLLDFDRSANDDDATGGGGGNNQETDASKSEAHNRLLSEVKKEREAKRALEAEIAAFKKKEADAAEAEAIRRGEHEKVIAQRDADLAAEREARLKIESEVTQNKKFSAFLRSVGAQVDPKFYGLIDVDKIKLDASGKVDDSSVKEYAEEYKKAYPETFVTQRGTGGSNNGLGTKPQGSGKALTIEEWKALPYKEREARLSEVVQSSKK